MEIMVSKKTTYSAVWTFFELKNNQNNDDESREESHTRMGVNNGKKLVNLLAKEMIPISTVKRVRFTKMVKKLDPQYEVP